MPNLVGQTQAAATTMITAAGLTLGAITNAPHATVPAGSVISHDPAAGTNVLLGSAVALVISSGPPDVVPPTANPPAQSIDLSSLASATATSNVNVKLTWSATDNVGVKKYDLQRRTNTSTTWTNETISPATAVSKIIGLTPGNTYQFRVRATDGAGNVSNWADGPTFRLTLHQETLGGVSPTVPRLAYTGTWASQTVATASGGAQRFASVANATATITFTGSNVAWVAVKGRDRGLAEVVLDGILVGTIDLFRANAAVRNVVFERSNLAGGEHTLQIRVLGTKARNSTGTRVDLDAFVTGQ